jgi:hypothetical protein
MSAVLTLVLARSTSCVATPRAAGVAADIPLSLADFKGKLAPGSYVIGSAATATTDIQLDCALDRSSSAFSFAVGGALVLDNNVKLVNCGSDARVKWAVDGAIDIMAQHDVAGNIVDRYIAGDMVATGAISLAAQTHLSGFAVAGGALNVALTASIGAQAPTMCVLFCVGLALGSARPCSEFFVPVCC